MSNDNMTSLFPNRKVARKELLLAQEIRKELATYFLSGGRVEYQNDCAEGWHLFEQTHVLEIYFTLSHTPTFVIYYLPC
jgi:hypothetical protein